MGGSLVTGAAAPPETGEAAVTLRAVRHAFEVGRAPLEAVAEVDLEIGIGQCLALVGPSGCGKSTLLRILAGLVTATGGQARVFGRAPAVARRDGLLGAVFQDSALFPWRTVEQNARLPADLARLGRDDASARVRSALRRMGVEEYAGLRPHQLSGGMKQRVAVARALVLEPRLLLMDEPFASLDYLTREALQEQVAGTLRASGIASLLVTHDVNEAVFMADRVVVLTERPARVAGSVRVDAPAGRVPPFRDDARFHEAATAVRRILKGDR